ncbi:hypothetical protein HOD38_00560 [archaeon]|jgi:hypothetical protein|nr:hypothetical protein [archaeon]MBT4396738.1 hypothetical protein [archaeon]MBT4441348.1 hypothetical protein [archaeon]
MLETLLLKRLFYADKKYRLIQQIQTISYRDNYNTINEIRGIISKELLLNFRLQEEVKKLGKLFPEQINNTCISPLRENLKKMRKTLHRENKTISKINHFNMIAYKIESILYRDTNFFEQQLKLFKSYYDEEIKINNDFKKLIEKTAFPKDLTKRKNGFLEAYEAMALANREIRELANAIGNTKLVQKRGKHLLILLNKIKKSEFHEFIQQDVDYVITKVKEVVANPNENKLKITLFGIYLVAPTTFEITFIIMLTRYATKMTITKTKKLAKKIKKPKAS